MKTFTQIHEAHKSLLELEDCLDSTDSCQVKYDQNNNSLNLSGGRQEVFEKSLQILNSLHQIQELQVELNEPKENILKRDSGGKFLKEVLKDLKFCIHQKKLIVLSKDVELGDIEKRVENLVDGISTKVKVRLDKEVNDSFQHQLDDILNNEDLLVVCSLDSSSKLIIIEGCQEDLEKVKKEILELVERTRIVENKFFC